MNAAVTAQPDVPSEQLTIDDSRTKSINRHLAEADQVLEEHFAQSWWRRLFGASGAYQAALASVYRAGEDLMLVQSDAALAARLPGLRTAVRSYLSSDDPRREMYLFQIDAALTAIGAERLAAGAQDLNGRSEMPEA
ncbi:hypothetical protein [Kribbella antiqua]|nr:hypothetical protein [Kribbella antiqua]